MPDSLAPPAQRGRDICHQAFRQTLDLLRVTDNTLAGLCSDCPRTGGLDTLIMQALDEMALSGEDQAARAPGQVFFAHRQGTGFVGVLYALGKNGYAPAQGTITVSEDALRHLLDPHNGVLVSNPQDDGISAAEFQSRFPPLLRDAVKRPIRNFISYRIAGDWPGAILALNYPGQASRYEAQVLSALAITLGSLWTLTSRIGQVEESFLYLVGALARASEVNDEVTGDHILRVSEYAKALARKAGLSPEQIHVLGYSAQLHDVGKLHTPSEILRKQGPLTPEELVVMREHVVQGERIIGTSPRLAVARRIAGGHHENWDGSGYPRGLAGEAIPLEARLVRVVDVYDALRSERPYKHAYSHDDACRVMLFGDDRTDPKRQFDPHLLEAFRESCEEFRQIHAGIQGW